MFFIYDFGVGIFLVEVIVYFLVFDCLWVVVVYDGIC